VYDQTDNGADGALKGGVWVNSEAPVGENAGVNRNSFQITGRKPDGTTEQVAKSLFRKHNFLYLGRHLNYPIALEGALKLKEISYIHAEGYAAGELKHGPIALIDTEMPVVVIATKSHVLEKTLSSLEEVKARGAQLIVVATEGVGEFKDVENILRLPPVSELLSPIVNIIPLQMLAYHIADLRGCDVDQPRNLAKSVTVE
jgi:glucosamine--fructose-6-phosphate aminotransferase (isomerizing)